MRAGALFFLTWALGESLAGAGSPRGHSKEWPGSQGCSQWRLLPAGRTRKPLCSRNHRGVLSREWVHLERAWRVGSGKRASPQARAFIS